MQESITLTAKGVWSKTTKTEKKHQRKKSLVNKSPVEVNYTFVLSIEGA
jgi:hypothetical protein